ncbi:MAG: SPFH domain-containing protein, partial [Actinomycetota bacterium]
FLVYASTNKVYGGMEDVAVVEEAKRYRYRDYPEGLRIISPWDVLYIYNVRVQEVADTVVVLSSNGLPMTVAYSVRYRPDLLPGGLDGLGVSDRRLLEEFPSLTYP